MFTLDIRPIDSGIYDVAALFKIEVDKRPFSGTYPLLTFLFFMSLTEAHSQRTHHPFSPSQLQALESCPCYEGSQSENQAAFLGTLQHEAVDRLTDDPRLSDERAFAVADCITYAEHVAANYRNPRILRELYMPIDEEAYVVEVGGKLQLVTTTTGGFADIVIISEDETEGDIIDWKFGRNAVTEAKTNLQGIAYLLGVFRMFPNLKKIRVRFLMPHLDQTSEHTFTSEEFADLTLRVKVVVSRARVAREAKTFETARPNVGACMFCANIGKCPAVAELALKLGRKYAPAQIPDNVSPTLIADPRQVEIGIRLADIVKTWAEAFRRQATEKTLCDLTFIPDGYKLVQMPGKIRVLDEPGLENVARQFLPPEHHEALAKLRDIPITKIDELISLISRRGEKEATVERFRDALVEAGVVTRGDPFPVLRQDQRPNA